MPYKDPDIRKAKAREYAAARHVRCKGDSEYLEMRRASSKAHYEANKDAYVERAIQWKKDHPEKVALQRARQEQTTARKERARRRARDRKAKKMQVFVESVDRRVLFQRDEGICGICNLAVDPDRYDVDHIVPLACGGEHSYANTQIAHPICNNRKSDG